MGITHGTSMLHHVIMSCATVDAKVAGALSRMGVQHACVHWLRPLPVVDCGTMILYHGHSLVLNFLCHAPQLTQRWRKPCLPAVWIDAWQVGR